MGDHADVPLPNRRYDLRLILTRTAVEGNLGAVARAMLNFGFDDLHLLTPEVDIGEDARRRAKHAGHVLDGVSIDEDWESAIADCSLVIGTSGKRETGAKTLRRHFLTPWEFAERLSQADGKVALVFGPEGMGLSREELRACDLLVTVPTWEGYPILNLSHAVSLLLYELHRMHVLEHHGEDPALPENALDLERRLDPRLRELLRQQFEDLADALSWPGERKRYVADTFIRTILRGQPTSEEARRMLGAILDATNSLQFAAGSEQWRADRRRRITPRDDEAE